MICNECETVAHCTNHGCIPKQPAQQEPVAWMWTHTKIGKVGVYFENPAQFFDLSKTSDYKWEPLYTSPPTLSLAQRKPLTDEEIKELYGDDDNFRMTEKYVVAFARAIEAKLKEKNNG